ncbi:unnamed protein product [Cyclocybe aegerita]|uniref:Uncharacterized protein n=1 Tax=Cyclocybe aegerita TaxID=1973307 RepID=A0A8S0WEA7_CYCAE|nr:unnamed protein product [Cyclocybe aegerita]
MGFASGSAQTSGPGQFPTTNTLGNRSISEPPATTEDVDMDPPFPRSHSEYTMKIPYQYTSDVSGPWCRVASPADCAQTQQRIEPPPAPRAVSPAPTEIEEPESQDIIAAIQSKGVKVRDFGYDPLPVTEMFDQYKAITEVDYRWSQGPERLHAISGKTLRRLLKIGWLTQEEVDQNASPADLEELAKFDARKEHPWKTFRPKNRPTPDEREKMLSLKRPYWFQLDKIMAVAARDEYRKKLEAEEAVLAAESLARRLEKGKERGEFLGPFSPNGTKRCLAEDGEEVEPKRRRLSPEPYEEEVVTLVPPEKQYPAPLHSYDPEIYPEAAGIIEASSQSQSQPRPIFRFDTPPLEEEPPAPQESPGRGNKLVHPRKNGMKRGLSRTQTFAEL